MKIKDNARLLFIGDSITDADRDRSDEHSLSSFSLMVERHLNTLYPYKKVEVFNRGISGQRSCDLLREFDSQVKHLKPDCVVMLIGINDTWRRYDSADPTSPEDYYKNVKKIVTGIKKLGAELMVLEPFITKADQSKKSYYEDLALKIAELRQVCREEKIEYVPLDGMIAEYEISHPEISLSDDSVHPNDFGRAFIASAIIERLEIL